MLILVDSIHLSQRTQINTLHWGVVGELVVGLSAVGELVDMNMLAKQNLSMYPFNYCLL